MNDRLLKHICKKYGRTAQKLKFREETRKLCEAFFEFAKYQDTFKLRKLLLEICDYLNMFQQIYPDNYEDIRKTNLHPKALRSLFINVPRSIRDEIIKLYIKHHRVIQKCRKYKIKRTLKRLRGNNGQFQLNNRTFNGNSDWNNFCTFGVLD